MAHFADINTGKLGSAIQFGVSRVAKEKLPLNHKNGTGMANNDEHRAWLTQGGPRASGSASPTPSLLGITLLQCFLHQEAEMRDAE